MRVERKDTRFRKSASAERCSAVGACPYVEWAARPSGKRQRQRSALGLHRRAGAPAQDRKAPHRISPSYPQYPYLSMSKELQRRGEDLNLRRQACWRSGLLLLHEARCIKPLCHLSTRCPCSPFRRYETTYTSTVMFEGTNAGASSRAAIALASFSAASLRVFPQTLCRMPPGQ